MGRAFLGQSPVSGSFTAPVVYGGTSSPQPWLATGYADGPFLADAVTQYGPLPVAQRQGIR